jgi:hypothetical protein
VNQQLTPDGRAIVKADFLNHLRKTNNVARAAELAGISDDTAYHWRRLDEDFARERADAHLKEILAAHGIDPKLLEGPQVVEGALVEADPDAPADVLTENPDQALEHAEKALD